MVHAPDYGYDGGCTSYEYGHILCHMLNFMDLKRWDFDLGGGGGGTLNPRNYVRALRKGSVLFRLYKVSMMEGT